MPFEIIIEEPESGPEEFVPPLIILRTPVTFVGRSIVPSVMSAFTICPNAGAAPVPRKTVFAAPTPIVKGAVPAPPPISTPLAVSNADDAIVVLLL